MEILEKKKINSKIREDIELFKILEKIVNNK